MSKGRRLKGIMQGTPKHINTQSYMFTDVNQILLTVSSTWPFFFYHSPFIFSPLSSSFCTLIDQVKKKKEVFVCLETFFLSFLSFQQVIFWCYSCFFFLTAIKKGQVFSFFAIPFFILFILLFRKNKLLSWLIQYGTEHIYRYIYVYMFMDFFPLICP